MNPPLCWQRSRLCIPDKWAGPCLLVCAVSRLSRRCVPSLSPPNLFISREKTKQRASWGMWLLQEKLSTADGDRSGLGASFLGLGTLRVLQHCRGTESLDCLGMEAPSPPTLHAVSACKTSTGAREGCAHQTPGCTPGKGCDHHSRSSRQGQRQATEVCLLPNTDLERHPLSGHEQRGRNSKTKAQEKKSMSRVEENVIRKSLQRGYLWQKGD